MAIVSFRSLLSIAALTFGLLLAPASAQASCGDWLASHEAEAPLGPSAPPSAPVCRGPHCRQAPPPLPAAPDAIQVSIDKCLLARAVDHVPARDSVSFDHPDSDRVVAAGSYPPLDRPPRS